jgi:hypothetical protein
MHSVVEPSQTGFHSKLRSSLQGMSNQAFQPGQHEEDGCVYDQNSETNDSINVTGWKVGFKLQRETEESDVWRKVPLFFFFPHEKVREFLYLFHSELRQHVQSLFVITII